MMCSTLSIGVCRNCDREASSRGISIDMVFPQLLFNDYVGFSNGDFLATLVLRPALNRNGGLPVAACAILHDAATGQGITQAYHAGVTHFEVANERLRIRSNQLRDILSEKGHAQHTMGDDTIKPHTMRGLFVEVDRIGITRRGRVAV